jgi:hypothetical protein
MFGRYLDNLSVRLKSHRIYKGSHHFSLTVSIIDLVLNDSQSVGKRTHDLMDTVNVKKRWKTISWRVNKYLKYNHLLPRFGKEQTSFCI